MYEVKQDVNLYSVFLLFWKVFLLLFFENMENEIIWENILFRDSKSLRGRNPCWYVG